MRGFMISVFALALACDAATNSGTGDYMDRDIPTGSECGGTGGEADCQQCEESLDCGEGQFCGRDGDVTECVAGCVGPEPVPHACVDDAGCCDPDAFCSRGWCVPRG